MHNNKLCLASTELAEFFNTSFLVKLQFMNHKSAALPTVLTKHIIIYTLMYIRFLVILKYFLLREGEILFTLSILILRVCRVMTEQRMRVALILTHFHSSQQMRFWNAQCPYRTCSYELSTQLPKSCLISCLETPVKVRANSTFLKTV